MAFEIPITLAALAALAPPAAQDGDAFVLEVGLPLEREIDGSAPAVHTPALDATYTLAPTVGLAFRLAIDEPGPHHVALRSHLFDAYLVLRDGSGRVLAEDDDGLLVTHAGLEFEAAADADYVVEACALHGRLGPFEIALERGPLPALAPAERARLELEDVQARVELLDEVEGPESEELGKEWMRLGRALVDRGRLEEGVQALERAAAIRESVLGDAHPDAAVGLHHLALAQLALGHGEEARASMERSAAVMERARGPDDLRTAVSLNNLAWLLADLGLDAEARPLYERSLTIRERVLGPDHPDLAVLLNNLALLCERSGQLDDARRYHERALALRTQALGPGHPDTARSLGALAAVLLQQGEVERARETSAAALAAVEAALGPRHEETARRLNAHAELLQQSGDPEGALPLYERSLAIREEVLGPDHPETATGMNDLAHALMLRGDLAEARELYERALEVVERRQGPDHPQAARVLNNLAELHRAAGDPNAARPLYARVLEINAATLGAHHLETARSRSNLALLLRELGDLEESARLLEQTLADIEGALGERHAATATALNNLGTVLRLRGEHERARELLERALAVTEELQGRGHPARATALTNLGGLYAERGDLEASLACHEEALRIREAALGPGHPLTAQSHGNLALDLRERGRLAEALPHFERALAIREELLGPTHRATMRTRSNLAGLLADLGETGRARASLLGARGPRQQRVRQVLAGLTEAERYDYLAQDLWQLELLLSLCATDDPDVLVAGYDHLLDWKGQVARTLFASRELLARELTDRQRELLEQLRRASARLSLLASAERTPESGEELAALVAERERLELELAREARAAGAAATTFAELSDSLPEGTAVVDLFAQRIWEPGTSARAEGPRNLVAWITRRGADAPARVDLGPLADVEAAVAAHVRGLVAPPVRPDRGRPVAEPAGEPLREPAPELANERDGSDALRALLWEPLADLLAGADLIAVSPDGAVGALPLGTIPLADGSYLIEHHAFLYPADLRALVSPPSDDPIAAGGLLAVGEVDFGSGDRAWSPLPATGAEVDAVRTLHARVAPDAERLVLRAGEATEERLKRELGRHAVLHLATHGFFQRGEAASAWTVAREAARGAPVERPAAERDTRHLGLLSGLVCAGANETASTGDDGYLTAEEVGWLDLSSVELVVLSACETGLGRARSGEGLIGLRRAFRTAGAATVVSSLWAVQDETTAELMRAFYANLWERGTGRLEALRAAQLGMLRASRERDGEARPAAWGAFVLSGEWR